MTLSRDEKEAFNRDAAKYYGLSIAGLFIVAVLVHWWQLALSSLSRKPYGTRTFYRPLKRILTGVTLGPILLLPQYASLALIYLGLNVVFTCWQMEWTSLPYLGSRFGWLALCNMCLVVFLGLKNTPLSPLAGYSFDSLNLLHRFCGYTTILEVVLHASCFASGLIDIGAISELQTSIVYAGAVAGVAMVLIGITANGFFRSWQYEIFYVSHLILVAIILVSTGLHQPEIQAGALIVTVIAACLWLLDRLVRWVRVLSQVSTTSCTIWPLPDGATKIIMNRSMRAHPGSHVFLWVPSVRMFQQHPFSMISVHPVQMIVAARDGFTSSLYQTACTNPGVNCRATIEGPYGSFPDITSFNTVFVVCAGTGATFALSVALDWARKTPKNRKTRRVHFVCAVRARAHLQWFEAELQELRAHPRVFLKLFVTQSRFHGRVMARVRSIVGNSTYTSASDEESSIGAFKDDTEKWAEKGVRSPQIMSHGSDSPRTDASDEPYSGRPVVAELIDDVVNKSSATDSIIVTGSGPTGLLADLRAAAANRIRSDGPDISLHIEEFEW